MNPIDEHTFLLWIGLAIIVSAVSATGMIINRYLTHRAHRRAIEQLNYKKRLETKP